jgi:GH25 family lysozyme M1 (1,4-beta-N-acetylmuramidase)
MLLGVDLASYQGAPDFDKVKGAGYAFGMTKVTENINYVFPGFRRNRDEMHRTGMGVGFYHFARGGNPTVEADFFLGAIGPLQSGECLALDWEISHNDPVRWCGAFLARCYARVGVRPFIYLNYSTATGQQWGDVAVAGFPLWLARYDKKRDFPGVPYWGTPVIKQFDDAGTVPGINGKVDLNCFNGDMSTFYRFGANASAATAPATGADSLPSLQYGDKGPAVASLQGFIHAYKWNPPIDVPVTGNYLDQTADALRRAQLQMGIKGGDGRNVGPQTKHGLWDRGWRG